MGLEYGLVRIVPAQQSPRTALFCGSLCPNFRVIARPKAVAISEGRKPEIATSLRSSQ